MTTKEHYFVETLSPAKIAALNRALAAALELLVLVELLSSAD